MNIEESIKNWVVLDNQHKKLNSQISKLRDEKNELTQTIINYYDFKNTKYPNINISDGKLSFIQQKIANPLSVKFLEQCFEEFFENYDSNSIKEELIQFIKSKRTHNINTNIRRVYNKTNTNINS
jgi:hypothetical protein